MGKGEKEKGFFLLRSDFGKKLSEAKRKKESLFLWSSFVMKMDFDDDRVYVVNVIV